MNASDGMRLLVSVLLVLGSAFFVAAEYALVGSRRSSIEALAKKGNRTAKALLVTLEDISPSIAGTQIGITMLGIAIGSYTEPFVTEMIAGAFGRVSHTISYGISFLAVSFVLVVVGELCPKYLTLKFAERTAVLTYRPLRAITTLLRPLIWLAQSTASLILRPLKVDIHENDGDAIPKEELLMLIQSGGAEGVLEKTHADMVSRALRLDVLAAHDIMIHRLDIKWLDVSLSKMDLLAKMKEIPYSRIPVCRNDIDDMVGVLYSHDVVKHHDDEDFLLERIARPVVAIPENVSLDRIVQTMRQEKTQMLIVMDEYGGTSGLITLEDVVEEVFGELEDTLEVERPTIEQLPGNRISARAEVRYDELVSRLNLNIEPGENTDTLATIVINALDRIPKLGDRVDTELGLMRVENMARRRITRVSIQLRPELLQPSSEED